MEGVADLVYLPNLTTELVPFTAYLELFSCCINRRRGPKYRDTESIVRMRAFLSNMTL